MVGRLWIGALCLFVALAGCSDDVVVDPEGPDPTPEPTEGAQEEALAEDGEPTETTFYLTSDVALAREAPDAGLVPFPNSQADWATGIQQLRFLSEAVEEPMLVGPGTLVVDLFVISEVPLVSQGAFDVAVWGGSTTSMPLVAITTLPGGFILPGEVKQITFQIPFDSRLPVLVPIGGAVQIDLASGTIQEGGQLKIVVGGETPSTATVTTQVLAQDPTAGVAPEKQEPLTGTIYGGGFAECDIEDGVTTADHVLQVGPNTTYLRLTSSAVGTVQANTDLDIDLFEGSTLLGGGHTPGDVEHVLLAGPTLEGLEGKELTVRVTTCFGGAVDYEVIVETVDGPSGHAH